MKQEDQFALLVVGIAGAMLLAYIGNRTWVSAFISKEEHLEEKKKGGRKPFWWLYYLHPWVLLTPVYWVAGAAIWGFGGFWFLYIMFLEPMGILPRWDGLIPEGMKD
jgi:hypothetical protein